MPIDWWMDKKTVTYPHSGILPRKRKKKKEEWTADNHNINECQNYCAKWKKEDTK